VDQLFVLLQRLTPKYLMTGLVCRIARIRIVPVKNFLIRQFIRLYAVDVSQLTRQVPEGYPSFNDFFIRDLADGARPVDGDADSIVSPVDGTVSAAGRIERNRIFQAKGIDYTLDDLLATDTADAGRYVDGSFATIYLAPYNYHRIHAPLAGELTAARYVPGDLYSVNEATVRNLPNLFARNERLVCHFDGPFGSMAVIFVGALNVGTVHSIWSGDIRPRKTGTVESIDLRRTDASRTVSKGDMIGWFNMGSTVILLLPQGVCEWDDDLEPGETLRMGEEIGELREPAS